MTTYLISDVPLPRFAELAGLDEIMVEGLEKANLVAAREVAKGRPVKIYKVVEVATYKPKCH